MTIRTPANSRIAAGKNIAAYSPLSVANCELWLDASDAASVTTVSGGVSQWNDLSGNDRHATQTVANNRPTYTDKVNGRNVITFDGTNDSMATGLASSMITGYATLFCVCRPSSTWTYTNNGTFANKTPLLAREGSFTWGMVQAYDSATYGQRPTLNWFWRGVGFNYQNGPQIRGGVVSLYCVRFGASDSDRRVSGDASRLGGLTSGTGGAATTFLQVGQDQGLSRWWTDYIAEVIVYSRSLGTDEMRGVESYLINKWAIPQY